MVPASHRNPWEATGCSGLVIGSSGDRSSTRWGPRHGKNSAPVLELGKFHAHPQCKQTGAPHAVADFGDFKYQITIWIKYDKVIDRITLCSYFVVSTEWYWGKVDATNLRRLQGWWSSEIEMCWANDYSTSWAQSKAGPCPSVSYRALEHCPCRPQLEDRRQSVNASHQGWKRC